MAPIKDDCTRLSLLGAFSFVCVIGESDIIIERKRDYIECSATMDSSDFPLQSTPSYLGVNWMVMCRV
jgi:hypothetical protein